MYLYNINYYRCYLFFLYSIFISISFSPVLDFIFLHIFFYFLLMCFIVKTKRNVEKVSGLVQSKLTLHETRCVHEHTKN